MLYDQLEVLEEKIIKAVQLINKLQNENKELVNQIQEKEKTIQQLHEECQKFKLQQNSSHLYREREEIKKKVVMILSKLDNLQQDSSLL